MDVDVDFFGTPVGAQLRVLDTKASKNIKELEWRIVDTKFPGSPRFSPGFAASSSRRKLYVISGTTSGTSNPKGVTFGSAVDAWSYDVDTNVWTAFPPVPGGLSQGVVVLLRERYLVSIGGTWRATARGAKGGLYPFGGSRSYLSAFSRIDHKAWEFYTRSGYYGQPTITPMDSRGRLYQPPGERILSNKIIVYDLQSGTWMETNELPFNINRPSTVVTPNEDIWIVGGESDPLYTDTNGMQGNDEVNKHADHTAKLSFRFYEIN